MGVSAKDIVAKLETLPVKLEEGATSSTTWAARRGSIDKARNCRQNTT